MMLAKMKMTIIQIIQILYEPICENNQQKPPVNLEISSIIIVQSLIKIQIMILSNRKKGQEFSEPNEESQLTDLIKISFKQSNFLSTNGKNTCVIPKQCHEEILSSINLVKLKNIDQLQIDKDPKKQSYIKSKIYMELNQKQNSSFQQSGDKQQIKPIKVGQLFYMQFYFTDEYLYHDNYKNQLLLSKQKKTAFKIIENIRKGDLNYKTNNQIYDYIGNVMPNELRYLIVLADDPFYLKFNDHQVYLGNYDERCLLSFTCSLFRIDRSNTNRSLLNSPCRLFSVEEQKYIVFDTKANQIIHQSEPICFRGICRFQRLSITNQLQSPTLPFHKKKNNFIKRKENTVSHAGDQISIRIMQNNNELFLTHNSNSSRKLIQDLSHMLRPVQHKLNTSNNTFFMRYQPNFSIFKNEATFNLSNVSKIGYAGQNIEPQEQQKQQLTQELSITKMAQQQRNQRFKEYSQFFIEFYPSYNHQYQIFIHTKSNMWEHTKGALAEVEKTLYLDYQYNAKEDRKKYILKEYNKQNINKESTKLKNLLRVEFITKEMIKPFIYYEALILNLKIYNYYKSYQLTQNNQQSQQIKFPENRSKFKLNSSEIEQALKSFCHFVQSQTENNKEKLQYIIHELLELKLLDILQQLFEAVILKHQFQMENIGKAFRENMDYFHLEAIKLVVHLISLIQQVMVGKLISALLNTPKSLLFIRLCQFPQLYRHFASIQYVYFNQPQKILSKLESIIEYAKKHISNSKCRNICILWGYRIIKNRNISSKIIESYCSELIQQYNNSLLSDDQLIIMQLIKLSKGQLLYCRDVVKEMNFSFIQKQEISFSLRQAYLNTIITSFEEIIHFPLDLKQSYQFYEHFVTKISRQNKLLIISFLEDILPKLVRFETYQNKMLSFRLVELYLQFNEGIKQPILIEQQQRFTYTPLLLAILEQHLDNYIYESEHLEKYVSSILDCMQKLFSKHIHDIVSIEMEKGEDEEELFMLSCLDEFERINYKTKLQKVHRENGKVDKEDQEAILKRKTSKMSRIPRLHNLSKLSKKSNADQMLSKMSIVKAKDKLLEFFFKSEQKNDWIVNFIDKSLIWTILNSQQSINTIKKQTKLDIFQKIVNISSVLLFPLEKIKEQIRTKKPIADFSLQFTEVLYLLVNKAYKYNFWNLIERLAFSNKFNSRQWAILIAIFHKNTLLKYFLLYQQHCEQTVKDKGQSSKLISKLFNFLREMYKYYFQTTKQAIRQKNYKISQISDNSLQLQLSYQHSSHQLEPTLFFNVLTLMKITYIQEQIQLHILMLQQLGVITESSHYEYYQQYIVRYQCYNYNIFIIRLILVFLDSLTQPLKVEFANNYQYSLFKQAKQIKRLICQLTDIEEQQKREGQGEKKRSSYQILSELDERQIQRSLIKYEETKQVLTQFFRLLFLIEKYSSNHKQILSKLSFPLLINIVLKYNSNILLKMTIVNYISINMEKQIAYRITKYLKNVDKHEQYEINEDENEQYETILNFIKNSNYLFQKQLEYFKEISSNVVDQFELMKYIQVLIGVVKIRDSISKYFNREHNDKVQRSPSSISSESIATSRMNSIQDEDLSNSPNSPQDAVVMRARQLLYYHSYQHINQNELQNILGVNKLLCYQIVEKLQNIIMNFEITKNLHDQLLWLENNYKITLHSHPSSTFDQNRQERQIIYQLDKSYIESNRQQANAQPNVTFEFDQTKPSKNVESQINDIEYQSINSFLSLKIQNYLVLLIQLLQRYVFINGKFNKNLQFIQANSQNRSDQEIIHIMKMIQIYLNQEIIIYQREDYKFGKMQYEELPEEYYKKQGLRANAYLQQKYKQRCCKIERQYIDVLVKILIASYKMKKDNYIFHLNIILERLTYYNITNQTNLQAIIQLHFEDFYQVLYLIIHQFKIISPIVKDEYFIFKNILNRDDVFQRKVFNKQRKEQICKNVENYQIYINSLRGIKGYHFISLNFYTMMKMLISTSKTLNFKFKEIFSKPTVDKQSILSEFIDILESCIKNLTLKTEEKYQIIRLLIKLINTFLRGPIQHNIEVSINKFYNKILMNILFLQLAQETNDKYLFYVISIKKLVAEAMFILIPYIYLDDTQVKLFEDELKKSYIKSKKHYKKNYSNIIMDYTDKQSKKDKSLLYFDLALNFFYCLIEIYNKKGINKIRKIQIEQLKKRQKQKQNKKAWMVFYDIYNVFNTVIYPIFNKLNNQYESLTDENNQEQLLNRSIIFFSKHVGNIDVKVGNNIKKISFLLLKESTCYNVSIRKEFYRLIGREDRMLRLQKFMSISKYIIIRLQVNKKVKKIIQNFKPLEIIVTNRQLWKSFCFLIALCMNALFIFEDVIVGNISRTLFDDARYICMAFQFLFIIFIFIIYFVQVLPLKVKLYRIINKNQFNLKSLFIFFNDKTLGFAFFYISAIGMSIYQFWFISFLMIDYFFRFKISSKITFILARSTFKITYVVVLIFTFLYVGALFSLYIGDAPDNCPNAASCTQELFIVFMELRFNVLLPLNDLNLINGLLLIPRFILKIVNISLLVGILFMQKREEEIKKNEQTLRVRDVCFICGKFRNEIEKIRNSNTGFYNHVQIQHNLWYYIYYLIYLKNKERKNLNTIESMIIEEWQHNEIHWLPDQVLN